VQITGVKPTETLSKPEPEDFQDQEVTKLGQEMVDQDVFPHKEAENVKEEMKNKEDEEGARLYSDWTRGSVRRVTQQLEQRMKQEHETPSPSSSPPSLSGCTLYSPRHPDSIHSTTVFPPRGASVCPQGSVGSTLQEDQDEEDGKFGPVKRGSALVVEMRNLGNNDKRHQLKPANTRLGSTSSFHFSAQSPFASVNFLCLEGVTELESRTDFDCFTAGTHSDIIMRETWETLCELGAFLQQVSMSGGCKARHVGPALETTRKRGSSVHKRAREVEARIRQAGLTPPSLMKRSASLAKLGCLELLANDLSEWELSRSTVALPSAQAPIHTVSDESKKQRVHNSPSLSDEQPEALNIAANRLSEDGETSPGVFLPSDQSPERGNLLSTGQDSYSLPDPTLLIARQQYGRTHPLRRLKKRTVSSTLYHTM